MRSRFARTLDPHTVEAAREDGAEETTASVYSFLLTYTRANLPHRRKLYVIGTLIAFARKEEACVSELPRLGEHTPAVAPHFQQGAPDGRAGEGGYSNL